MADGECERFAIEYRRLVDAEYRFVYRLLFWLVRDRAVAEDLTQVTFLKAWKALPLRRSGSHSDRAWLAKIARRVAADERRRPTLSTEPLADGLVRVDPAQAVELQVVADEGAAELMRAVLALPEPYRAALVLTRIEQWSTGEAAQALGVPQGTVKWRVFRALRLLRTRLESSDSLVSIPALEVSHATPETH